MFDDKPRSSGFLGYIITVVIGIAAAWAITYVVRDAVNRADQKNTRADPQPTFSAPAPPPSPTTQSRTDSPTRSTEPPARLAYRWKDANGQWHISDRAPPEGVQAEITVLPR